MFILYVIRERKISSMVLIKPAPLNGSKIASSRPQGTALGSTGETESFLPSLSGFPVSSGLLEETQFPLCRECLGARCCPKGWQTRMSGSSSGQRPGAGRSEPAAGLHVCGGASRSPALFSCSCEVET